MSDIRVVARQEGQATPPFPFAARVTRQAEQKVCRHARMRGGFLRECIRSAQMLQLASSPSIRARRLSLDE